MREIELVGLYPASLSPCTVCRIGELSSMLSAEQFKEAPRAAVRDADKAAAIADAVIRAHGDTVRIRITPSDSPRGVWLAMRHRLRGRLQVIIDGRRRVEADAESVLAALA